MFADFFGKNKTFSPDKDIPDLSGKIFFVTGGNAGLGKESILQIAKHNPAHIYLGARNQTKAEDAIASIKKDVPDAPITYIPLDLASFESIKSAAEAVISASSPPRLDVLLNNAGVMATPPGATKDGYETQFGTNHMGHALLTRLLLPTLKATAAAHGGSARVVNLSSEGHNFARSGISVDKARMDAGNAWGRYGNSKLANILHAQGLAKHEGADGVIAVSVHPGIIYTDLYSHSTGKYAISDLYMRATSRLFFKTVAQGAYTQLWAATAPKEEMTNGAYYTSAGGMAKGSAHARNEKQRDELWDFTEKELSAKGY